MTIRTNNGGSKSFWSKDFKFDEAFLYKLLPYLAFLAFLGLIYIANRNQTERTAKEMNLLRQQVDELRIEYITTKADYMRQWRQTDVIRQAQALGLKESKEPPIKILNEQDDE